MGAKATFDPVTKIIKLTEAPDGDGNVFLDVQVDLYGDMKEDWLNDPSLRWATPPITSVGGNPLPGSKTLGDTYFLDSEWKIEPYDADQVLTVNGNFYSQDGTSVYIKPSGGSYAVQIESVVSNLVDSTIAQLPEIQYSSYLGGVHLNTSNGGTGTEYPAGTPESPVNNLDDALVIAVRLGFDHIFVDGDLTIYAGDDISGYHIIGAGATINSARTSITFEDGCITSNTNFSQAEINGVQGGESIYDHCVIRAISNTHCTFDDCLLIGPAQMVNSGWTVFHTNYYHGCHTIDDPFVIDYNHSPIKQIHVDFAGHIKFLNITHASAIVHITLQGGEIELDASCTAGEIHVHGLGNVKDNSNGTTVIITNLAQPYKLGEIHAGVLGKWDLNHITKVLTLYHHDEVTILAQFNLGNTTDQILPFISRTPV